jgi:hypothetical protein
MHRGRLPACCCRRRLMDGLQRPSGRNASHVKTPSPITSPTDLRSRTETSPRHSRAPHPAPPSRPQPAGDGRRSPTTTTSSALDARAPAQISSSGPPRRRPQVCHRANGFFAVAVAIFHCLGDSRYATMATVQQSSAKHVATLDLFGVVATLWIIGARWPGDPCAPGGRGRSRGRHRRRLCPRTLHAPRRRQPASGPGQSGPGRQR